MAVEDPAQYTFKYEVNDASTGDSKAQTESRNGDDVTGQYTLIDADGLRRTVDYTASEAAGFNAVVRREPSGHIVKKIVAAPAITKVIAPALYHAPAAHSHSTFSISSPAINYSW